MASFFVSKNREIMTQPVTEEFSDADLQSYMPQGEGDLDSEINRLSEEADSATEEALSSEEGEAESAEESSETETPSEPETATEPAPENPELVKLREENQQLQKEREERERQQEESRIQNAASEYAQTRINHYIQQGYDEQTARDKGISEAKVAVAEYRAHQATMRATAIELSSQYGVPREQLQNFKDEATMRQYAEQYHQNVGSEAKRVKELEARLAKLEKGQVPAQEYNRGGQPRGGTSDAQLIDRYNNGAPMTPDIRAALKRQGAI